MRFTCSMHKKKHHFISFLSIILLVVLPWPVHAEEVKGDVPAKHLLWSVRSDKNTVYLLGSIHILKKDSYPLPEELEKVYGCCSTVVFETDLDGMNDPASQKKMMELGTYPAGQTLSGNISELTYAMLNRRLSASGLQASQFEKFRPWFTAMSIAVFEIQKLGYNPDLGIDRYFFNKAGKDRKDMIYLETNEYQLRLMADMNRHQQELFLKETLKELSIIESMADDMIAAWKTGDAEKLYFIIKAGYEQYPDIYYRFFIQRNKKWLSQIEELMKQDSDVLVTVGAGHLVGKQSLIELLKGKGYKVEQR